MINLSTRKYKSIPITLEWYEIDDEPQEPNENKELSMPSNTKIEAQDICVKCKCKINIICYDTIPEDDPVRPDEILGRLEVEGLGKMVCSRCNRSPKQPRHATPDDARANNF